MAENTKPKVSLAFKEGDAGVERLRKAVLAFAELKEHSFSSPSKEQLEKIISEEQNEASILFIDQSLFLDSISSPPNTMLFNTSPIALKEVLQNSNSHLLKHSCINIYDIPMQDLVRILHHFVNRKNSCGVFPYVEKGSLIIGEKIHSQNSIGFYLDHISSYITEERSSLSPKLNDLRQVIASLLGEAFLRSHETQAEYNSVDIQFCASADKFVFTIRFPLGSLNFADLKQYCNHPTSLPWFLAAQGSDLLILTELLQFKEVEIKSFIFANSQKKNELLYKAITTQSVDSDLKDKNLLIAPKNYSFSLISELKNKQAIRQKNTHEIKTSFEADEPNLDPETSLKISSLEEKIRSLQLQVEQKELQAKKSLALVTEAKKLTLQKRSETIKILKNHENNTQLLRNQISEYEKKNISLQTQLEEKKSLNTSNSSDKEKISHFEELLKDADTEKKQAINALHLEQKKHEALEKKLSQIRTELSLKEKEVLETKQMFEQLKRAQSTAANDTSKKETSKNDRKDNSAVEKELHAKIRELTGKEEAHKQEIKKLNFKIETLEKTTKASQSGVADKAKLLEKKLEEAKMKEIELLKKVDELSAQIKKSAKAA